MSSPENHATEVRVEQHTAQEQPQTIILDDRANLYPVSDDWENGLCAHICGGDLGTFLASWFCFPCLYGRVVSRQLAYPNDTNDIDPAACCITTWFPCTIPCMIKRVELRKQFGIKGHWDEDFWVTGCCTPCSLAQMNMELKSRAIRQRALQQGQAAQPYVAQTETMVYKV